VRPWPTRKVTGDAALGLKAESGCRPQKRHSSCRLDSEWLGANPRTVAHYLGTEGPGDFYGTLATLRIYGAQGRNRTTDTRIFSLEVDEAT
jgi:hypothetical protein